MDNIKKMEDKEFIDVLISKLIENDIKVNFLNEKDLKKIDNYKKEKSKNYMDWINNVGLSKFLTGITKMSFKIGDVERSGKLKKTLNK